MSAQVLELTDASLGKKSKSDLKLSEDAKKMKKEEKDFLIDTQDQNLIEDDQVESCSMDEEFGEERLGYDMEEHSFTLIETSNEILFNSYKEEKQVSSQTDDQKKKDKSIAQEAEMIEKVQEPLSSNTFPSEAIEPQFSYISSCHVKMEEIRKRKRDCELKVQDLLEESYQQIENVMSAMVHAIQQRYSSFHDKFQVTEADLERKLKSHYRVEKKLKTIAALLAQNHEEDEE